MKNTILLFLVSTSLALQVCADDEVAKRRLKLLNDVYEQFDSSDSYLVIAQIESEGTPEEIAQKYFVLNSGLYRNKFDISKMLIVGQAGVRFCLNQSKLLADEDQELSTKLKAFAKAMAYNLSSNAWPGWEEPKVTITKHDMVIGLDLARLNLRLANELKRDEKVAGNAHWLVGAQHLGLNQRDRAIRRFEKAITFFQQAEQPEYEFMAAGYLTIAKLTSGQSNETEKKKLANAISELRKLGTSDAKFFAGQLERVSNYFATKAPAVTP